MSHNKLETAEDIKHLIECEKITVIDFSHNRLEDPDIVDVFANMKSLVSVMTQKGKLKIHVKYLFI